MSKEEAQLAKAVEIKDYLATVIITKNGYMKKFEKAPDDDKLQLHQGMKSSGDIQCQIKTSCLYSHTTVPAIRCQ